MSTLTAVPASVSPPRPQSGAWAEVRLAALRDNARAIRRLVGPRVALMAVVKADAYGHGLVACARAFLQGGATLLGVARLEEALALREAGLTAPILVLGALSPGEAECARLHDIAVVIPGADWLDRYRPPSGRARPLLKVHLVVDTGMGRLGVFPESAVAAARRAASLPGVELVGVATHFATADEPDLHPAEVQLARFRRVLARLLRAGLRPRWVHAANSAATLRLPAARFNLVRCGIALYGLRPSPEVRLPGPLQPALRVLSRVTAVRDLPAGASVGYGRRFIAPEAMRTATVAIGYGDGYSRALSGRGIVTFAGRGLPVLGRVSMDQIVVDARAAPFVRPGDSVTVFSDVPSEPHSVENVAWQLGTIPYEITCLLTRRVPRLYLDG